MKKTTIYIFDEFSDIRRVLKPLSSGCGKILMLPLTVDEDRICRTEEALRKLEPAEIARIPFAAHFNKKAFEVKDDFVKFIADFSRHDIGGRSLKRYFKYPFRDFSIWWFSLIAEKNTLKTDSFHNLVKLLTFKDLCKEYGCQEILMDISDSKMAEAIKDNAGAMDVSCVDLNYPKEPPEFLKILSTIMPALGYLLIFMIRSVFAKCRMPAFGNRREFLGKCKFLLVTYFPYFDEEKLKEKEFINRYYEPLQKALEKRNNGSFAWLAMTLANGKYSWNKNLAFGRRINANKSNFTFIEECAGFIDYMLVFLLYGCFSIKYFFFLPKLSRSFIYPESNLNIWRLFAKDWHDSFCGQILMEGLLYRRIFKNVFKYLDNEAKVIYLAEMHCWEKALNIASMENRRIKTIGIQHTIVPLLALMYFNDRSELKEGDYIDTMPRPDILACAGNIPAKIFIDSGWEENRVFSWVALRFQDFKRYFRHMSSWEDRKKKIVIALSIVPEVSREILTYVHQAFEPIAGVDVIIRSHPNLRVERLIRELGLEFKNPPFSISDLPLETLLRDAMAVIVADSSVSLEAIACGCPVIIPRLINFVDMNPMTGLTDLPFYVESPLEMRDVTERILKEKKPPFSYEKGRNFILNYCGFADSNEELLKRLEGMGN